MFCKRILASIVERFNTTIYALGLDLSKAFDTVNRTKLLDVMEQEKIGDADGLRLVRYLLSGTALTVRVHGHLGMGILMYMYFVVLMATCNLQVRKKAQFPEL